MMKRAAHTQTNHARMMILVHKSSSWCQLNKGRGKGERAQVKAVARFLRTARL